MKNQVYTGTSTSRRFALCPTTIKAGDPVLIGEAGDLRALAAVALDDYSAATGGTVFLFNGTFALTVIAVSQISPAVGEAINPGDPLFATGTFDSATNMTTGLTISASDGDQPFGRLDPSGVGILSGATDTAALVQLQG
jgi:hypothetical protein